jgi:serine/threonine protein phosphatase PrpC
MKINEGIPNLNGFIKFNDFHSNLIAGLEKMSPKEKNENEKIKYDDNKKKYYNKININKNINNNYNNIIEKKRSKSNNNKSKLRPNLFNNMNNQKNKKEQIIKSVNCHNSKEKIPRLINVDLTKMDEKKNKNISPKKIVLKNKKNDKIDKIRKNNEKSPKIRKIPSININLNEIEKKEELKCQNIKKINNNNNRNIIRQKIEEKKEPINNNNINNCSQLFKSYYFCEYPNKEYRESMEDFHDFKNLSNNNFICFYFAIFDGHNGKQVSLYLKDHFHKILFDGLKNISFTNDYKSNNEKILFSIKKSFEIIDKDIINNKNIKDDIGSTATIFLLYRDPFDNSKKILITANVGDSKGFLINKEKIKQITKDHNCSDASEVERIKKKGGVVFQGRVFGTLILTRSLGDKEMKQYGVLAKPYCYSSIINENVLYLIVGSDGAWDVLPSEQLFELSKEKMSSKDFAKKIVKISIEKGSVDNISCLVIKLN